MNAEREGRDHDLASGEGSRPTVNVVKAWAPAACRRERILSVPKLCV